MNKIVLISCASKKLNHKAKAKDLYISPLFKLNLIFAKTFKPNKIFILSAKYGLVNLNQQIETYNKTLNTMKNNEIKVWAGKVKKQMKRKIDFNKDKIIFLAGIKYRKYLINEFKNCSIPLEGLSIGKQLQYLKNKINHEK
ncbi:MAG TPA: hypothetical protein P5052_00390 [Candidatus Paceibacterota bacterium]|jgi:hypothetical protein|nr:hypothetical protein [Candidatus Paceibacterota bacterium]HRZ29264.1 hypothetical protein [Candidatus Paceibacterota bacterium]